MIKARDITALVFAPALLATLFCAALISTSRTTAAHEPPPPGLCTELGKVNGYDVLRRCDFGEEVCYVLADTSDWGALSCFRKAAR